MMQGLFRDLIYVKQDAESDAVSNLDKISDIKMLGDKIRMDTPVKLLEILIKYNEYISRNISYAQITQCMSLELWEAIHD